MRNTPFVLVLVLLLTAPGVASAGSPGQGSRPGPLTGRPTAIDSADAGGHATRANFRMGASPTGSPWVSATDRDDRPRAMQIADLTVLRLRDRTVKLRFATGGETLGAFGVTSGPGHPLVTVGVTARSLPRQ